MADDTDLLDKPDAPLDDTLSVDPESMVLSVQTDDDGGVTIELGKPDVPEAAAPDSDHDDNLAEHLDEELLGRIGWSLIDLIKSDDESRQGWLETRAEGVKMLGLTINRPDGSDAPAAGISTITHPLLLEAVLRFQANARAELLPTDGPVKIRNDERTPPRGMGHNGGPPLTDYDDTNDLADALEQDFNHYLTSTATEFVPSTDQMLFWVGLGGMEFKKVYHDAVRRRPVSEWVDAKDLIVSNDATDIESAGRVTQRIRMRPAQIKRMQLAGAYRHVDLGDIVVSEDSNDNPVDSAIEEQQGVSMDVSIAGDQDETRERTLYECYCELDIDGYEHRDAAGKITGLPLPYKVVLDEETYQILEIRRNWTPGEDDDIRAKQVFVPFTFVNGLGFYGIGLLHILGNTTNAATAAWRLALDAAMLASFPGGLISEEATRQDSINLTAGVGQFRRIKTGGGDIRQSVMPFPYPGPNPALMALQQDIVQTGSRIGGTAETMVGEGRQDAPVGTTMALLEQAKIPLDAVHKRLHAAQSREFDLLTQLFREDPAAFWRGNKRPATTWDETILLKALSDFDLVPMADPNTSSQLQRQMRAALIQQAVQAAGPLAPQLFNLVECANTVFRAAKIPNYEMLIKQDFQPPQGGPPQDPSKLLSAQAQMLNAQANQAKVQVGAQDAMRDHAADLQIAQMKSQDNQRSLADQAADRRSKEQLAMLDMKKTAMLHGQSLAADHANTVLGHTADAAAQQRDHQHQAGLAGLGHVANAVSAHQQHGMVMQQAQQDAQHGMAQQAFAHGGEVEQQKIDQQNAVQRAMIEHYMALRQSEQSHEQALEQIKAKPVPKPAGKK